MRRGALALLGTVLGTALLIGARLGHPAPADEIAVDAAANPAPAGDDPAGNAPAADEPTATAVAGTTKPGRTPAPGATATTARNTTAPAPRTSAPRTTTAPPPAGFKNGTFAGTGASERYGTIKVTIVVSGGAITSASATCTNPCNGESASISAKAFSGTSSRIGLNAKTVTAQSANISSVSGATYTSAAYKQSLAAAINLAKA